MTPRKAVLILGHNDATQFIDIVNQYVRVFDSQKFEVTVAYLTGEENADTRARTIAEHVIFLNQSKKQIRGLKIGTIRTLITLCNDKQFEIVIAHRYKPIYCMLWASRWCKKIKTLVCVMHELGTMQAVGRKLLLAIHASKKIIFAGVSNAVRDDLRESLWRFPKNQTVTLYNVIDAGLIEPALISREEARRTLPFPQNTFIFGTVGRLVPNKDQKTLITAFSKIKSTCPNAKLIIMGDGVLKAELEAHIHALQLENEVTLMGFVAKAYVYLRGFDCFVLPSTQEAFGRVLLEAMIAKCPIIATSVNGIPEVVDGAGILIAPRDVTELSEAMRHIYQLGTNERQKMTDNAYQHMHNHFSIEAFKKQFWDHIDSH